jgi:hypothetical protein
MPFIVYTKQRTGQTRWSFDTKISLKTAVNVAVSDVYIGRPLSLAKIYRTFTMSL